ncbi:putative DNA-binding protein (MmcQ/YjbR family) [Tenacibaculum gallaicum]|uniref:Putative DNA-binding protein (MmcQ/YjbR family) n=1 Tax=Tenacibaculum gallaicum TaxID=561505 RepID=A0A3E0HHG6_9FLAO|nr:MmcQ/YjbR family DNA-binding protein [Tenacibaculum gallaicum]REH45822.1 putative DNA-binding protein (MmcQ/YjbR family) [Tenacibaculum gallaicum]
MNIEEFRNYCITKKGVTEHFPFDDNVLVFKVMDKMFALSGLDSWEQHEPKVNLKCEPERALELRAEYESINPGFHMSKKHWNTVTLNNDVSDTFVFELIDRSCELIVKGLTKKLQEELKSL